MKREHMVRIAFEADRSLCAHLGLHAFAARKWANLSADQRAKWMETGPEEPDRARLYAAVLAAVEGVQ